jgi:hypothetical protein
MANKIQKMHCISLDKNSTFMSTPTEILFSALQLTIHKLQNHVSDFLYMPPILK